MLAWGPKRRGLPGFDDRLKHVLPRIGLAIVLMAAVLFGIETGLAGWWQAGLIRRVAALAALVGGGLATYGLAVLTTGVAKPAELRALLRRPGRSDTPPAPEIAISRESNT